MSTARRIRIAGPGSYEQLKLENFTPAPPAAGELRIATSHIGINYADCVVRMGLYKSAKEFVGWPITPGFEVSGVVEALGEGVDDLAVGDPVIGVTLFDGYSSQLTLPRSQVFRRPENLSAAEAAGVPAVFLTAWFALRELAHVRPGERVLIHSAAGGVGCAAVQLAAQAGARVTAVVGAAHKRALPRELGAEAVIVKSEQGLWREAEALAPDGFDVILDPNGIETLGASYAHLAPLGRLVIYGFHTMLPKVGGRPNWLKLARDWLRTPRFNPLQMTSANRNVLAFNLSFLTQRADLLTPAMETMLADLAKGQLQAAPVQLFPFKDVAQAHQALESAQTVGKLVLEV